MRTLLIIGGTTVAGAVAGLVLPYVIIFLFSGSTPYEQAMEYMFYGTIAGVLVGCGIGVHLARKRKSPK